MRINWIDENVLACGGIPISIENLASLKSQGIKAIATLTEHPLTAQKALATEILPDMGFENLHVPIVDQNPPTKEQVEEVFGFVNQMKAEGKPVYLHCHAGVGRTGTMVHAVYLLSGMEFDVVKAKIKITRPASQFFMLSDVQKAFLEDLVKEIKP
jgi:atypical dual specificity phosphatase